MNVKYSQSLDQILPKFLCIEIRRHENFKHCYLKAKSFVSIAVLLSVLSWVFSISVTIFTSFFENRNVTESCLQRIVIVIARNTPILILSEKQDLSSAYMNT